MCLERVLTKVLIDSKVYPQSLQNLFSILFLNPHFSQNTIENLAAFSIFSCLDGAFLSRITPLKHLLQIY